MKRATGIRKADSGEPKELKKGRRAGKKRERVMQNVWALGKTAGRGKRKARKFCEAGGKTAGPLGGETGGDPGGEEGKGGEGRRR